MEHKQRITRNIESMMVETKLQFSDRGEALIGQEMFHLLDLAQKYENKGKHIYHLELGDPKNYKEPKK